MVHSASNILIYASIRPHNSYQYSRTHVPKSNSTHPADANVAGSLIMLSILIDWISTLDVALNPSIETVSFQVTSYSSNLLWGNDREIYENHPIPKSDLFINFH